MESVKLLVGQARVLYTPAFRGNGDWSACSLIELCPDVYTMGMWMDSWEAGLFLFFPHSLLATASTTLSRRNAKLQDSAVQSQDSEEELTPNVQWLPFQMAAMVLMYTTERNLQRQLEAGSRCEGWAGCRRGGEGLESRSSHPFSKGAAFGIQDNQPLQASVL